MSCGGQSLPTKFLSLMCVTNAKTTTYMAPKMSLEVAGLFEGFRTSDKGTDQVILQICLPIINNEILTKDG